MPLAAMEGFSSNSAKKALTDEHRELVRWTWKQATKPEVRAGMKLFQKLFEIAPDAVAYFSNTDIESDDFQAHINSVMSTLNKAVQNLENLTELRPALERLGAFHATMGVRKEQLAVVKEALLFTLSHELKDVFTDKCQEAWELTFKTLAEAMCSEMTV